MRLHYKGKYNLDPDTLPHGAHKEGAVKFKEAEDSKKMSLIANGIAMILMVLLLIPAYLRCRMYLAESGYQIFISALLSLVILFPHELLHAICFKEDVYLYTNWAQGMLFVVGPEVMTKAQYVFMSLLPNLVFGLLPYVIGMIVPQMVGLLFLGALALSMGAGDYYNVYNALTQMPKGAKTYLYKFNSYWYLPKDE